MTIRIAFLGLGAMGTRMATNLREAGFDCSVWNRTPGRAAALRDAGAVQAASPRDAAQGADIVIAMVRDDAASHSVWFDPDTGALAGMSPNAVAVECSTLSLGHVAQFAEQAARRGVRFVDAPLAGSRPQAEARQLIFLVGGAAADLERVRPALDAMGGAVHHCGGVGAGAAMKLAVNSLFAIQVAGLAEILGMLEAHGVAPDHATDILGRTPVMSLAAKGATASMVSGAFAPMFPVELVEKDLGYAQDAAPAPMATAARSVMQNAMAAGFGADNLTGVVRLYRGA